MIVICFNSLVILEQRFRRYSPGDQIIFTDDRPETGLDIWSLPIDSKPVPLEQSSANEFMPALSPDGRLLAFVSDESGRNQVYVRILETGERRSVSIDGGHEPLWSNDGSQIYFRKGYSILAADVTAANQLSIISPRELFRQPLDANTFLGTSPFYDVTEDGKRFLVVSDRATTQFKVITNWFSEVSRIVSGDPAGSQ